MEFGQLAICGNPWDKAQLDPFEIDDVINNEGLLFGIPGFDNVFQGFATIFQIVTMESWVYMMYSYNATNEYGLSMIFFIMVIILGNFFIINLIIAQYVDKFTELKEQKMEQESNKKQIKTA